MSKKLRITTIIMTAIIAFIIIISLFHNTRKVNADTIPIWTNRILEHNNDQYFITNNSEEETTTKIIELRFMVEGIYQVELIASLAALQSSQITIAYEYAWKTYSNHQYIEVIENPAKIVSKNQYVEYTNIINVYNLGQNDTYLKSIYIEITTPKNYQSQTIVGEFFIKNLKGLTTNYDDQFGIVNGQNIMINNYVKNISQDMANQAFEKGKQEGYEEGYQDGVNYLGKKNLRLLDGDKDYKNYKIYIQNINYTNFKFNRAWLDTNIEMPIWDAVSTIWVYNNKLYIGTKIILNTEENFQEVIEGIDGNRPLLIELKNLYEIETIENEEYLTFTLTEGWINTIFTTYINHFFSNTESAEYKREINCPFLTQIHKEKNFNIDKRLYYADFINYETAYGEGYQDAYKQMSDKVDKTEKDLSYQEGYQVGYKKGIEQELDDITGFAIISEGIRGVFEALDVKMFYGKVSLVDIFSIFIIVMLAMGILRIF